MTTRVCAIIKIMLFFLLSGALLCACGKKEKTEREQADRTVRQYEIQGLTGYCVDEAGEYLYCSVDGSPSIYQYGTDGSFIGEITVEADGGGKRTYWLMWKKNRHLQPI